MTVEPETSPVPWEALTVEQEPPPAGKDRTTAPQEALAFDGRPFLLNRKPLPFREKTDPERPEACYSTERTFTFLSSRLRSTAKPVPE